MVSIPKINLGINRRKSFFDKSHDVNTTSDFGFMQPTLFSELIPNSKVNLKSNTFVRLAPMPTPSFARVQVRQYTNFVPLKDVFMAFDYMMSDKSVSSSQQTYTPKICDNIKIQKLMSCLFDYNTDRHANDDFSTMFAVSVLYNKQGHLINPSSISAVKTHIGTNVYGAGVSVFIDHNSALDKYVAMYQSNYDIIQALDNGGTTQDFDPIAVEQLVNYRPTLTNADFIVPCFTTDGTKRTAFYIAVRLTKRGQRLFKVLRGLGVQFKYDKSIPLTSLFAYYKTWFDLFNPSRTLHWMNTDAYYLIHSYFDYYIPIDHLVTYGTTSSSVPTAIKNKINNSFINFLFSLSDCCYTLDVDPLTVCMQNPWQNNSGIDLHSPISEFDDNSFVYGSSDAIATAENDTGTIDSFMVRGLLKIQPFLNKNSVIGQKVDQYMKVHFGQSVERGNFIGSSKFNCNISDVIQMAGNDSANLGEYAGKGVGFGDANYSFESKEFGFLIQLTGIIPFGGYSQSVGNSLHVNKDDFYQPFADSLGYESVPLSSIFGSSSYCISRVDNSFGFRPRFMGYKYHNNLRNGDFARRGHLPELMPYNLDRFFKEDDLINKPDYQDGLPYVFSEGINEQVTENLRYIGKSDDYGNYNRLFYDSSDTADNFIINMVQEFKLTAPMIAISDSYDTFDDQTNGDNSNVSVQHS